MGGPHARLIGGAQWEEGVVPIGVATRSVNSVSHQKRPANNHDSDQANGEVQWVTAATAPDQLTGEMWRQLLLQEAIPSMLEPHDTISFLGVSLSPVRVLVPLEMVARAREVLADIQGFPSRSENDNA